MPRTASSASSDRVPSCCGGRCRRSGWWRTRTTARTALAPPQPEGRSWPCGGSAWRCSGPAAGSRPAPAAGCEDRRSHPVPRRVHGQVRGQAGSERVPLTTSGALQRMACRPGDARVQRRPCQPERPRRRLPGRLGQAAIPGASGDLPPGRRLRPLPWPPRWSVHTSSTRRSPGHDACDLPHQLACGVW